MMDGKQIQAYFKNCVNVFRTQQNQQTLAQAQSLGLAVNTNMRYITVTFLLDDTCSHNVDLDLLPVALKLKIQTHISYNANKNTELVLSGSEIEMLNQAMCMQLPLTIEGTLEVCENK